MFFPKFFTFLLGFFIFFSGGVLRSAVPTTGAYSTDIANTYVHDQVTQRVATAQMIFCFMYNVRADAMVNLGQYIAYMDEVACGGNKDSASNSTNQSSSGTSSYTRMSMTSTRASNISPQIVKGHAESDGQQIYIYASSTEAPSDTYPNGLISMDFAGVQSEIVGMRGSIAATATGLSYAETGFTRGGGGGVDISRLTVDGNETSGSGVILLPNQSTFDNETIFFGYNSEYYCRRMDNTTQMGDDSDNGTEYCFQRLASSGDSTVWKYGLYDDDTGAQYDLAQPGFNIKLDNGSYGFASYWGIWSADAWGDNETVTNDAGTEYYAIKGKGKLIKYTAVETNLNNISKVPFIFTAQENVTWGSVSYVIGKNYEAYYDADNDNYTVTGVENCNGGCFMQKITGAALSAANLDNVTTVSGETYSQGVRGWSQGLQSQIEIKPEALVDGQGNLSGGVRYRTQTTVAIGDTTVPTTLYCAGRCFTGTSLASYTNGSSPYTAGSDTWGPMDNDSLVKYTWDPNAYTLSDNTTDAPVGSDNFSSSTETDNSEYHWGMQTGILVGIDNLTALQCEGSSNTRFCPWQTDNISTFYRYETGQRSWNTVSFVQLASTGDTVNFTAPEEVFYDVPENSDLYGDFAGARLRLEYMGFGNLHGIPGKCFSKDNNTEVSCGSDSRYIPAFSIPDGTELTVGGVSKWTKALEKEIRMLRVDNISTDNTTITYSDNSSLPDALPLGNDDDDPSKVGNEKYAGDYDAVDFDEAPAVIHGVVQ